MKLIRTLGLAAVTLCMAATASAQQFVNVLTGGTSGVYYPLGVALSQIYGNALPDAKVAVQSTKASAEPRILMPIIPCPPTWQPLGSMTHAPYPRRGEPEAAVLHARDGEVIQCRANAFARMVRVDCVEPDLAYLRLVVELDRHETDDSTSHLCGIDLPAGLGREQGD